MKKIMSIMMVGMVALLINIGCNNISKPVVSDEPAKAAETNVETAPETPPAE